MDALIAEATRLPDDGARIDVDAAELILPGDMPARLNRQLVDGGFAEISGSAVVGTAVREADLREPC